MRIQNDLNSLRASSSSAELREVFPFNWLELEEDEEEFGDEVGEDNVEEFEGEVEEGNDGEDGGEEVATSTLL